MTKISPQAQAFMAKIIKHYPLNPSNCNRAVQEAHNHSQKPQQHLHDYRKERQIYDKSTKEKIQNIEFFKEEGNGHYKNGRYSEACYFYQKAIVYGDYTFPDSQQETEQMNDLLQKANCNLGLCLIKLEQWDKAKLNLVEASKGNDQKIKEKALYWLAKYYLRVGQLNDAQASIQSLKKLSKPSTCSVQQLEQMLSKSVDRESKHQKKLFSSMFCK